MKNMKEYDNINNVADRFKITVDDLIHSAVNGLIDIATFIDFSKVTHVEPYPIDTVNVPKFNSGLYFISKKDIIKFHFNCGEDSITINHIYLVEASALDEDFPSPFADDDFSSYPEMDHIGVDAIPLLCLIINDYTVHLENLVIPTYYIEILDRFFNKKKHYKIQENTSSTAINTDRKTYLLIITTLSKIIRGEFPDIEKHPILEGSKSESKLIEELADWKYNGLGTRNLQNIFSEAKNSKKPEVSDNAILLAIGAMLIMILGTYHHGKKHPSISSESNLLTMLPTLEPSLREVDSQSIFTKAKAATDNA